VRYEVRLPDGFAMERRFETLDEIYAYAAGAIDVSEYDSDRAAVGPWEVWRVDGDTANRVLGPGELLALADRWRTG
jgi:hypothetical protein